jgi:hypothetical protein
MRYPEAVCGGGVGQLGGWHVSMSRPGRRREGCAMTRVRPPLPRYRGHHSRVRTGLAGLDPRLRPTPFALRPSPFALCHRSVRTRSVSPSGGVGTPPESRVRSSGRVRLRRVRCADQWCVPLPREQCGYTTSARVRRASSERSA